MTSKQVPNVRLVKCPKCLCLLAELAELPVYVCGGCGTVLQAQMGMNGLNGAATEDEGSSGMTQNLELIPVDRNDRNIQNESCNDRLMVSNFPIDTAEITFHVNVDSSSVPVPPVYQEQIDHSQKIDLLGHDCSDFSDMLEEMHAPKSPATTNANAYVDKTVDEAPPYPLLPVYKSCEDANFAAIQERLMRVRGKFPMNDMSGKIVKVQDQARNAISSDESHHTMNYSGCSLAQPPKHQRHSNQMRFDDDESLRCPFYAKNGSPSSHWHDEFQGSSSVCSPENPMNYSQEKLKLLRLVYKLQDHLNRTHIGRKHAMSGGTYYSHEASQEQIYHDLGHLRYPRRYREGEEWSHHIHSRSSQMPFSGAARNRGVQGNHPYLHCYCCNKEPGMVNLGRNCYSGQNPRPSVHQCWMDSMAPLRDPYSKSNDQGGEKFHIREKSHKVKKHYRPIAGGAPFITCYLCVKPLQLPADFLSFRRKCHKLKCGACSMVLKFSLENGNHVLPFVPGNEYQRKLSFASSYDPVEKRKNKSFSPSNHRYKDTRLE